MHVLKIRKADRSHVLRELGEPWSFPKGGRVRCGADVDLSGRTDDACSCPSDSRLLVVKVVCISQLAFRSYGICGCAPGPGMI